ncbi:hypothetical protein DFH07DRAFT_962425 [Mycena maculata]|uniref:Uncharacterized protein n=1 Tax=Mycena maculata TaxID=230809 RepID=A0AAD7N5P0_9AGAR|nr:hypothetical protein DFH07DRAFT_962425 [Mycena maculata]
MDVDAASGLANRKPFMVEAKTQNPIPSGVKSVPTKPLVPQTRLVRAESESPDKADYDEQQEHDDQSTPRGNATQVPQACQRLKTPVRAELDDEVSEGEEQDTRPTDNVDGTAPEKHRVEDARSNPTPVLMCQGACACARGCPKKSDVVSNRDVEVGGHAEDDEFSLANCYRQFGRHDVFGQILQCTPYANDNFGLFEDGDTVRYSPVDDTMEYNDPVNGLPASSPPVDSSPGASTAAVAPSAFSRWMPPPPVTGLRGSSPTLPRVSDTKDSDDDYAKNQEEIVPSRTSNRDLYALEENTMNTEEEDTEDMENYRGAKQAHGRSSKPTKQSSHPLVKVTWPGKARKASGSRKRGPAPKDGGGAVFTSDSDDREDKFKGRGKAKEVRKNAKKGKAKTSKKDIMEDHEDLDEDTSASEGNGDNEDEGPGKSKTGPVSKEVRTKVFTAQDRFLEKLADIGVESGHDIQVLHQIAGMGGALKMARRTNSWNTYSQWHSEKNPIEKNTTRQEYARQTCAAYKAATPNLSPEERKDSGKVFEQLPWLCEWYDATMAQAVVTWRNEGKFRAKVKKAVQPMVQQSRLLHESFGIHVWGFVINTQGQASFMWGGTKTLKGDYEHIFGMQEIREQGETSSLAVLPKHQWEWREQEYARDTVRQVFSSLMGGLLHGHLQAAGEKLPSAEKFKMPWTEKFLDYAYRYKLRVVNYPTLLEDANQIIGTHNFLLKKVKDPGEVIGIEASDDEEEALPEEDQGEVALVVNCCGKALQRVRHSKAYHKDVEEAAKEAETAVKKAVPKKRSIAHEQSRSRSSSRSTADSACHCAPLPFPLSSGSCHHGRQTIPSYDFAPLPLPWPTLVIAVRKEAALPLPAALRGRMADPGAPVDMDMNPHVDLVQMRNKRRQMDEEPDTRSKRPRTEAKWTTVESRGRNTSADGSRAADAASGKVTRLRLKFDVKSPAVVKRFYASGFKRTSDVSWVDRHILVEDETGGWKHIGGGLAPILATEEDEHRYWKEIGMHGLE